MLTADDVLKLLEGQISGLLSVVSSLQDRVNTLETTASGLGTMATQNADSVNITGGSVTVTGNFEDTAVQYVVPTNNFNITITDGKRYLQLDPAGILATGAVTMAANPRDGQEAYISTSKTVSGFTLSANAGQSIVDTPITLTADKHASYKYNAAQTTWYRFT